MFNFLNLGFDGYRRIAQADLANARMLSRALEGSGYYTVCPDSRRHLSVTNYSLVVRQRYPYSSKCGRPRCHCPTWPGNWKDTR